ncbi:hypothetical protein [Chitinophaga ginsengisegetis]|uniref:hypothetical protein n=1 Tax=Chitinophaga ginsengisegetis TaxID=393003 RepID=UPI0010582FEE|nr:hypothetical protein [Chitinophaga ginsengisegetis]MDR6570730.1 hypothetical protein [Chitinophaga ginsengisegetis]MDR6650464.1 hypothetical protein [Chitinophaga ginsengisegetis]MDR6656897.1 hypothetical protein [Chitinophaga ginsengisegetis]
MYKFDFLYGWDDQWFVTNHYTELGFSADNLYEILTNFHYGQYAPLNQLYYTLLYNLFGYNPAAFHVAGVCLHVVNIVLVYFFIDIIGEAVLKMPRGQVKQTAFMTALLFALLPVNVEPVAWVAASKVTLYTGAYLAALICYCRYLKTDSAMPFYGTILFFILSFAAKEQAVLLPVCLLLIDYVYNRNFSKRIVWMEKLPFFILAVLFGIITIKSQGFQSGERSFYSFYQRVPLAFYTVSEYFTKCLIPVNLSYLVPFPFQIDDEVSPWLWIYVVTIPLIIYCFYKQIKRNRWLLFGLVFFFIHIVLVANLFPLARFAIVADRYAYLASIGLCLVAAYLFVYYMEKTQFQAFVKGGVAVYAVTLMLYSMFHIEVWTNAWRLKKKLKYTIEHRPDYETIKKYNNE